MLESISLGEKRVVLENPTIEEQRVENSNLILPSVRKEGNIRKSKVLAASPDCQYVNVGDYVLFDIDLQETFGENTFDDKYIVVKEANIHAKILHHNGI